MWGISAAGVLVMDASPPAQTMGVLQYSTMSTLLPPQGKKRAHKGDEPAEASSSKRVKSETSRRGRPARVRLPRPSKVNAAAKAALKEKAKEGKIQKQSHVALADHFCKLALVTQPKWKLLPSVHSIEPREIERGTPVTVLKPRLWTSVRYLFNGALYFPERSIKDREELLAILPEMCGPKSVNGVSWLLYENPMLILDDTNAFFEAHKVDDSTMDLVTYATS